ncbi:toxin-antitoxin system YwqK family antitoxin [Nonomuraea sp. NPDC049309]|uniref:toxin-antitoxin system YwqK family antitoxin n=1 Tax=Nonomuraea sp. NPDC049309 TaxID=3364350 RepID=UPI00372478BB
MTTLRVPLSETDIDDHDRVTYRGQPLTGVTVETRPDGSLASEAHHTDGLQDGPERVYWPDQTLKLERVYRRGLPVSERTWHRNGRLAHEMQLKEGGELVSEQWWDEDGNPIPAP